MQVYGPDAAVRRYRLPDAVGFWLDYWGFLHADSTHPIWSYRPFGICAVAEACGRIATADPSRISSLRTLVKQTASELEGYRNLGALLPHPPPSDDPLEAHSGNRRAKTISTPWIVWAEHTARDCDELIDRLRAAVVDAVAVSNLTSVAFYSRRLASELSVTLWSPTANRRRALQLFLDADNNIAGPDFSELLTNVMTPPAVQKFDVRFSLAPVAINKAAVRSLSGTRRRILLERSNERNLLVGLEFIGVEACEESGAASLALDHLVGTLDTLRTRWYIRAQVQGKIAITDTASAEFGESLPHPFWTGHGRRRQPPSFPTHFMRTMRRIEQALHTSPATVPLDSSAPDRWEATRWHISRAIATWPEDRHASASHIWQGIESLAGTKGWRSLITHYIRLLPSVLVDDIAVNFAKQRRFCLDAGMPTDWYPWNSSRISLETWHNRTTNRHNAKYWKTWASAPPPFYFGENVGLLTMFRHPHMTSPPWMEKQLLLSLLHLNALRNSVVHEGYRLGNGVVADHLGHLGLELLFSVIANQFADQEAVLASMDASGPMPTAP